jgi:glycosyltransferase involved in cell wall biosynthesis
MKIVVAHPARFPVVGYGGTERVVWWLIKGLAERGHDVVLFGLPGSKNPYGKVVESDFSQGWEQRIPDADVRHFFFTPPVALQSAPYLVTIEGNAKKGEQFAANTVFVSRNHAQRHGGSYYVYNGIDLAEYPLRPRNKDYWIFLAKASWRVKNVRGAIRAARAAGVPLEVVGGGYPWIPRWRGVRWRGMLGGAEKLAAISGCRGLLFPVLWHEPFGIAVVEALALGAPVVATPFGSLPELVPAHVGYIAHNDAELVEGIRQCKSLDPQACRQWVEAHFTNHQMTDSYLELYRKVQSGPLHVSPLVVTSDQGSMLAFDGRARL